MSMRSRFDSRHRLLVPKQIFKDCGFKDKEEVELICICKGKMQVTRLTQDESMSFDDGEKIIHVRGLKIHFSKGKMHTDKVSMLRSIEHEYHAIIECHDELPAYFEQTVEFEAMCNDVNAKMLMERFYD